MIILLLLVTMAPQIVALSISSPQREAQEKGVASARDFTMQHTISVDLNGENPLHAYALKRTTRVTNFHAYESLSPKLPAKYLSKRPAPIDAWTDYHLDRYFNSWGPREYFLYAMKVWREQVHNTYNGIHLELEDLYG